ncbi:MAG: YoaK family protein [Rhodanobacteraceae bacterium]
MIRSLPRWVWFGGTVLALLAGMVNAVGYLSFDHQGVTHMTGTTTLVGISALAGDHARLLRYLGVLVAFLSGAVISGSIIRESTLHLGQRYGAALLLESGLLLAAVPLIHDHANVGLWIAACACGLQNAMASTFSGAVVRTTHMTGIVTDLGILLGHRLRGLEVDGRRIGLYLLLFGGFLAGGFLGALAFDYWKERTLLLPAALAASTGLGYIVYRRLQQSRASARQRKP